MDELMPLSGRSRSPDRRCYLLLAGVASSARCRSDSGRVRPRPNHSRDRWPEMMAQGTFVARSLLVRADWALFRPPPVRWAYHTSCGPL